MKIRPILLAWLLLLGSTLAMGGAAWWLLDREADRVETLAEGTLANGTASVAESVDLLMDEIRTGVMDGLMAARKSPEPQIGLAELAANNPYVKSGFYYQTDGAIAWYGDHAGALSPSELKANNEGKYPWTIKAEESQIETANLNAELTHYLNSGDSAQTSQNSAPTDVYEAFQEPVVVVKSDYTQQAEELEKQGVQSKSEALKQQRANVRQVLIVGNSAVKNRADNNISSLVQSDYENAAVENDSPFDISFNNDSEETLQEQSSDVEIQLDSAMPPPPDSLEDYVFLGDQKIMPRPRIQQQSSRSSSMRGNLMRHPSYSARSLALNRIKPMRQGWTVSEVDGEENWLAWVELPKNQSILGAWLNRRSVLAEIAKTINISQLKDVQFALVDDRGQRIAGAGGARYGSWDSRGRGPQLVLDVGATLPGWRIEAYPAQSVNPFGGSFRLLGGLVVVGLSLAILLGGSLLLWMAQRDAREAQRKTTFVANVSHELKTPLTSIRLFAEMLHDGRAGDETKQRRYLQTMLNETQRLTRLVNNVLDFSRLERGRRDFQAESMDVVAAVDEIIEAQRERLQADGMTLEFIGPSVPMQATIDRDAIEQILLNLLDNAAKYALSGERTQVRLQDQGSAWELSVCDFGPGIPSKERQQVFEAFHRIDDRLTAERPGCGLGLSIAARLAEGMGGQLSLSSNEPQGCCFTLTVPISVAKHA